MPKRCAAGSRISHDYFFELRCRESAGVQTLTVGGVALKAGVRSSSQKFAEEDDSHAEVEEG